MEALHFPEPSLVRLAINALQGVDSSLITIQNLSPILLFTSADRTPRRSPEFWTRSSSTVALGNLLNSIGQFGCIIFLLRRLVHYFGGISETEKNSKTTSIFDGNCTVLDRSLINQAFAISVGKIIEGYVSALNTLSASVSLRRLSKINAEGCLSAVGNSEITLLEVYLHTAGLRSQIEALGNICKVNHLALGFPVSSLEEICSEAQMEFTAFPRNAALISFLYAQLKVADPENCGLLKFLFLQSCEPYCGFIRSWIFEGTASDPYNEFVVESITKNSLNASADVGVVSWSPLASDRARDGTDVPCFLEECVGPLVRTGQQLQMIIKLIEMSNVAGAIDTQEEILPCLSALSVKYAWFAVPLTFDKGCMEALVEMRASYYEQMLEKIENITDKFAFISQKAGQRSVFLRLANTLDERINSGSCYAPSRSLVISEEKVQITACAVLDYEISSILDEDSFVEDNVEPSECSSPETFEDSNDHEKLIFKSHGIEASYLSNLVKNLDRVGSPYPADNVPSNVKWKSLIPEKPLHYETYLVTEHKLSQTSVPCDATSEHNIWFFDGYNTELVKLKDESDEKMSQSLETFSLLDTLLNESVKASKAIGIFEDHNGFMYRASMDMIASQVSSWRNDSASFTSNPARIQSPFFSPNDSGRSNFIGSFVDFSSITDPAKAFLAKFAGDDLPKDACSPLVINKAPASFGNTRNHSIVKSNSDIVVDSDMKFSSITSPGVENEILDRYAMLQSISGGSSWGSLLDRSEYNVQSTVLNHGAKLVAGADLPLDFVIKKSLLDEILLQYPELCGLYYRLNIRKLGPSSHFLCLSTENEMRDPTAKYISKLAIKLLTDVFKLQEHLQSLRCFHFMELADWADLFIISLQHLKWLDTKGDKRISEIQKALELAIQRSSCEGDPHKDRLYVYLKGNHLEHLSSSAWGINSLNFMGLGYHIDWPVNIILTPAALGIYSDIFNFLMQVKLAVFSLSSAWLSLKHCYSSEQHAANRHQMTLLTETRHMVFHFVSTLQQYVRVQLSQLSWYKFQHSIKYKVKDMYDLESEHMAYLTESLHICFLSEETRHIAAAVENILQCAMEYHSSLMGRRMGLVQSIRRRFIQNLEELYLMRLKSPKEGGGGGIGCLWDMLNFNKYYGGILSSRQIGSSLMFLHE